MVWGEEDVQPQLDEGHRMLEAGDLDGAYEAFQIACNKNPDVADAHYGMGLVWFKRGDAHRAHQYVGRAVQLDPNHAKARQLLADCDAKLGGPAPGTSGGAGGALGGDDDLFGSDDLGLGGGTSALDSPAGGASARPKKRRRSTLETLCWASAFVLLGILLIYGIWFAVDNFIGGGGLLAPGDEPPQIVSADNGSSDDWGDSADSGEDVWGDSGQGPAEDASGSTGSASEDDAWGDSGSSDAWGDSGTTTSRGGDDDWGDSSWSSGSSGGSSGQQPPVGHMLVMMGFLLVGSILLSVASIWMIVLCFIEGVVHGVLALICGWYAPIFTLVGSKHPTRFIALGMFAVGLISFALAFVFGFSLSSL